MKRSFIALMLLVLSAVLCAQQLHLGTIKGMHMYNACDNGD